MAAMNANARAGPSRPRARSPEGETPSPINMVEELDPEEPSRAAAAGGISRNGLSVDENGEVTKVPAFLTKLYSMVNDPGTNELIHWSPKGDSFLIPYQEELARKILPQFFKHSNFQSFVRQLNMYAFHKVPHNSATPTGEAELWEFINPLFKRGQPELLAKITRRQRAGQPPMPTISSSTSTGSRSSARQAAHSQTQVMTPGGSFHPIHLITDGTTQGVASSHSTQSNGGNMVISPQGMIELSAITSGIAAIQRTQASIGADLKALQSSNEHLWREAMEQREKHKKHQETIDLIVSFLERLFGTDGEGLKGLKEAMRRTGLARTGGPTGSGGNAGDTGSGSGSEEVNGSARKKRRLGVERMIEDGRAGDGDVVEISSSDSKSRFADPFLPRPTRTRSSDSQAWDNAAGRFTTLPSDGEPTPHFDRTPTPNTVGSGSTPPSLPSENPYAMALAPYNPNGNGTTNPNAYNSNYDPSSHSDFGSTNDYNLQANLQAQAAQAASNYNLDPALLQTTIGSLLQSPAAAQMFLNSLKTSAQAQNLSPLKSQFNQQQQPQSYPDPTLALFNPLPNSQPLQDDQLLANQQQLLKSYEDAMGVGGEVERMQKGIDELVRSMGLDVGQGGGGGGGGGGGARLSDGASGSGRGSGGSSNDLGLDGVGGSGTDGVGGVGDTSLDEIFGVGGSRGDGYSPNLGGGPLPGGVTSTGVGGTGEGSGGLDGELDIPDGFDVDQFLRSLQDDQMQETGLGGM